MYTQIIEGIPVEADPQMSPKQLRQICRNIRRAWRWEGRSLGRMEIVRQEDAFFVRIYEAPVIRVYPSQNLEQKESVNNEV
ncbi:MAG TPA: hypothetical protein VN611_08710 [Patescibacteria group bacterium]|nr:hypothetical protein [Patescibacteria group bacterium]